MEIHNYINLNQDYLVKFKDMGLQVNKYNVLGLNLIKYKNDVDDFQKYFKSVIINQNTNKIISLSPMKSVQADHQILLNNNIEISRLHDGTMINLFYHNDVWTPSTRSYIGAKNYWNKDSKKSFKNMFNECFTQYDELNINNSYSFVLQHKDNPNISPITDNKVILVEEYSYENDTITKVNLNEKNYSFNFNKTYKNYHELTKNEYDIQKYEKGFNIYMNDIRYKMITDDYNYLFNLKPNHNNKLFTFLTLYKQRNLDEYLKSFPDDKKPFEIYKNKYELMRNELYNCYCKHFIEKIIVTKDVPYQLKPLIYELHDIYKSAGQKINMKLINDFLHNTNIKRLTFILNYY